MERTLDLLTWLIAIIFAAIMAFAQFKFATVFDDEGQLGLYRFVVAVFIGMVSQLGLFIAPMAARARALEQLIAGALMLPFAWFICVRLAGFALIGAVIFKSKRQTIELIFFAFALIVYASQLYRVSGRGFENILRKIDANKSE